LDYNVKIRKNDQGRVMRSTNIEDHITDIQTLFPRQLTLSPHQLAKLRNKSVQTLMRERKKGIGVPYKDNAGTIEYPIREVAIWLQQTIKTV